MRLNVRALAIAGALLWGGALLVVGLARLAWPGYGTAFLEVMASIYPGYHAAGEPAAVMVGAAYGALDGGLAGLILGWLYNRLGGAAGETG